jgi:hypothetical protein
MDVRARYRALAWQIVIALSGSAEPRMALHMSGSTDITNVRSRDDPTLRHGDVAGDGPVCAATSTTNLRGVASGYAASAVECSGGPVETWVGCACAATGALRPNAESLARACEGCGWVIRQLAETVGYLTPGYRREWFPGWRFPRHL